MKNGMHDESDACVGFGWHCWAEEKCSGRIKKT